MFPAKVPPWTAPTGAGVSSVSMTSRRPTTADSGTPLLMALESIVRSGVTPYSACAPPRPVLKPDSTSSKSRSAPASWAMSRAAAR